MNRKFFKTLSTLEYLKLNRFEKFVYNLVMFFARIPKMILGLFIKIWNFIKACGLFVANEVKDFFMTFIKGTWVTRVSYLVMGFGNIWRLQVIKGLFFLAFEVIFFVYMKTTGFYWLGKYKTLGDVGMHREYNEIYDSYIDVPGDDSFKVLLYGTLTIVFILAFLYTWRQNIKQNRIMDEIVRSGKKVKSMKQEAKDLVDDQFHKTLLALPVAGITLFTVLPIIFMILVAFTNYDGSHDGYANLFTWVGWDNFNELLHSAGTNNNLSYTFGEILSWTLIWAFFATFTNYFLGMIVAIMINKAGIKFKKLWRGILVLTIAIPQFVSLLYISKLFSKSGIVNGMLINWGLIQQPIEFWNNPTSARILVILINVWIGIPYLMLIATGILMNIPQDLYESAKIDGANVWQQYTRITLPYMLFVTGPYLLTSFINNINNFNVIFLLTGETVANPKLNTSGGSATDVDLLITWLFKITTGATNNYKLASVIGIMIFIVVAGLSLIAYNLMPSTKNEEDFS
ncbi:MAG: sugar ABC transporter permease [Lachnospiraceae bacterium]|nr:sugar ABC transporter permease [Lachnospiraceae bacterium]